MATQKEEKKCACGKTIRTQHEQCYNCRRKAARARKKARKEEKEAAEAVEQQEKEDERPALAYDPEEQLSCGGKDGCTHTVRMGHPREADCARTFSLNVLEQVLEDFKERTGISARFVHQIASKFHVQVKKGEVPAICPECQAILFKYMGRVKGLFIQVPWILSKKAEWAMGEEARREARLVKQRERVEAQAEQIRSEAEKAAWQQALSEAQELAGFLGEDPKVMAQELFEEKKAAALEDAEARIQAMQARVLSDSPDQLREQWVRHLVAGEVKAEGEFGSFIDLNKLTETETVSCMNPHCSGSGTLNDTVKIGREGKELDRMRFVSGVKLVGGDERGHALILCSDCGSLVLNLSGKKMRTGSLRIACDRAYQRIKARYHGGRQSDASDQPSKPRRKKGKGQGGAHGRKQPGYDAQQPAASGETMSAEAALAYLQREMGGKKGSFKLGEVAKVGNGNGNGGK